MADIFLSYASANREFVNRIRYFLEERSYTTWMDHREIKPGDDWESEIEISISKCKVFLVTVSEESNKSRWVKRECFLAESLNKATIPILRNGKLPFRLMDLQYVDFQENEMPFEYSFRLLLEVLKQHISEPSLKETSSNRHQNLPSSHNHQAPNLHVDQLQTRMYPEPDFVQQDCPNHEVAHLQQQQQEHNNKTSTRQQCCDELIRQIVLAVSNEDYTKAKLLQRELDRLEASTVESSSISSISSFSTTASSSNSADILDQNDVEVLETRASLEAKLIQLEDEYDTAFDNRNFIKAQEIVDEMERLEEVRKHKPSSAELSQQVKDLNIELELTKATKNIAEAMDIYERLLMVEAKAKIEHEAEIALGITVDADGVVRMIPPNDESLSGSPPSNNEIVSQDEGKPRALQQHGRMEQPLSTDEGYTAASRASFKTHHHQAEEDVTAEENIVCVEAHLVESSTPPDDMEQQILDFLLQRNSAEAVSVESLDTAERRKSNETERKRFGRFFKRHWRRKNKAKRQTSAPAFVCLDKLPSDNNNRSSFGEDRLRTIGKRDSIYYSRTV